MSTCRRSLAPLCIAALLGAAVWPAAAQSPKGERTIAVHGAAVHGYADGIEIAYEWFADPERAEQEAAKMRKYEGLNGELIYDKVEVVPETRYRRVSTAPRQPPAPQAEPARPRPALQIPANQPLRLEGTTWVGRETLGGYGRLEFRFMDNNQVQMIDAKEVTMGKWYVKGNEIALVFYDGHCTYSGSITNGQMSGVGLAGRTQFRWSIDKQR